MQQSGGLYGAEKAIVVNADMARQRCRLLLNSADMSVCDLIFCVDCHRQRFDSRQIQAIQLFDMSIGIFHATSRRLESKVTRQKQRNDGADITKIDGPVVAN